MFRFAEIENLAWFLTIPAIAMFFVYGLYRKRRDLEKFADPVSIPYLTAQFSQQKQGIKIALTILGAFFLVLTLMRPQGNPITKTVQKRGRDLVFVIDVSRSMLAEDLKPNRLGKAKQLVSDVINILEGDRIGLLVFAGATAVKCPLTLDYHYFRNILEKTGPQDVNRGGTHIGDAIRTVTDRLFYDQDNKYRDIILITDGEDHESFPLEAAETAKEKGIRIHTVGLGDPDGANIPLRKEGTYNLLKYKNQTISTKLDETTLKKIAEITHGVFIPVRTYLADLAELYRDYIATSEKHEMESKESKVWSELFQFFLGIAIVLLMVEFLLGERKFRIEQ